MVIDINLYHYSQFLYVNVRGDTKFWEILGVSYRKYKEQWQSKYKYSLKRYLNILKPSEVQYIVDLLELHDSSEFDDLIDDIDKGLAIFCAFEFCKGKKKFIKEYCSKCGETFESIEVENHYLAILKLYKTHPESLKNILIYYYWRRTKTTKVFSSDVKIEESHIYKLLTKIKSITSYLSKHNLKKYRFIPFGILEDKPIFIFQIDRQTGDRIKRNIEGVIRDKSVSELFLELDIEKQSLKIKSKLNLSESIISNLIISIEKVLKLKLFEYSEIFWEDHHNYAKFKEALTTPLKQIENEIKVTNLTFNRTKLPNAIPLELSKTSKRIDVKASINQLIENDFISLMDILYIDSLYIEYEKKQRKITVNEFEETGEIILKLNDSGLSETEKNVIQERFLNQFGLPVDVPINPKGITKNFDKRVEYLLNPHQMLESPRPIQIEDLRILNEKGLIRTKKLQRVRCFGCGFGNIEPVETQNCPECEEELRKIDDVIQVDPDKNGIKKYIYQLLTNEGLDIVNKNAVRKFRKEPINLIEIRYKGRKIFIYIADKGVNKKLLEYFQRASTPFFIVHVGHSTCCDLIDEKLFSHIRLSELINFEVEETLDNFISKKLDEQLTYSSSQISRSATKSAQIIKRFLIGAEEYSYDNLEDDTFNILKEIFQNSEKWGKEFIGVASPEGIAGFTFKDGNNSFNISFSWDCKFTETTNYNINNMNEVRKARDYIKKAIHSPSLKSFSKKLNAYFIVSNDIKLDDFQNYSEKVLKIREKSKPTMNLLDLDALYELHRLYHKHNAEIKTRENIFFKILFNTIVKKPHKASFKHFNREEIVKIFRHTLESNIDVELLDTVGVMESMKKDII